MTNQAVDGRSAFAVSAREAIIAAWLQFNEQHVDATPYAFALIGGPCAEYLGYAVPTEEGLQRLAAQYDSRGYRYQGSEWEQFDNFEKLATWLRWANPDDGWHYGDFPEHCQILPKLRELADSGAFSAGDYLFEEYCTDCILEPFGEKAGLRNQLACGRLVLGFTWGEDPRDFLRTATRVNPYPIVTQLWWEIFQAEETERRILSPYRVD
jgi:hypothetical protein